MNDAFVESGKEDGLALCGNRTIGTFRLEKVYHVYTRDVDENTNPYEAGLGWTVRLDKGQFIGRDALAKVKAAGPARKLVGFEVGDQPVTVAGKSPIQVHGKVVGQVTVVGFSPTLNKSIGLGYVESDVATSGSELTLTSDSGTLTARMVTIPFFDPKGTRIRA
jgi:aminomethyltransferase